MSIRIEGMCMRMDNRGFTLIEVLAVIFILGVIALITVPTITNVISKNKDDNYENLKKSIVSAAKVYMSDNRYNIKLGKNISKPDADTCRNSDDKREVIEVDGIDLSSNPSTLTLNLLVESGNLKAKDKIIINPKTDKNINLSNSYIKVFYNCKTKDYVYDKSTIHIEDQ